MYIILLGPPGAGKGTQADTISKKLFVPHISTGDIFRAAIKAETELGLEAKGYIDKGLLVPDEITNNIVKDRLLQVDCTEGFLLDGYPRTVVQAEILAKNLAAMDTKIDAVICIDVSENALIDRLTGRRICRSCGATYHMLYNPPCKEGICDNCGGELYQRMDDTESTVLNRLQVYKSQTAPLIGYYKEKGILKIINGEQHINKVFVDIGKSLGKNWA